MTGRDFSLTERLSAFVDEQVSSGRHQDASDVVREALRRYETDLREEAASLAALERLAEAGSAAIDRGEFTLVDGPDAARAAVERWNARAAARAAGQAAAEPRRG